MSVQTWRWTELLQMLKLTTASQALGEVRISHLFITLTWPFYKFVSHCYCNKVQALNDCDSRCTFCEVGSEINESHVAPSVGLTFNQRNINAHALQHSRVFHWIIIIIIIINLVGGTILPRCLFQKRYVSGASCYLPVPVYLVVGRRLMTIEWVIRQYNVNMQWGVN